ncbi:MAG TPA: CocE/NonD family hydrolase, partial [Candidatus Obscuribacterales bacterium]
FRDWVRHAQRDEYWQKADGEQRAARLQVPTLLMAGWYDPFLPSQLADYKTIQSAAPARTAYTSRLIIGPWSHAGTMRMPDGYTDAHYRLASLKPALDWYDHHLLHRSLHPFAPVRLFIGGINRWRDEQEWPLKRTRPTPIYLSSGGHANGAAGDGGLSLSPELPASADHYRHDPENPVPSLGGAILLAERSGPWAQNPVEARPDVLVYSSQPLPRNLELIGELKARLSVASSAPSTDFVVKLVDVHPDGQAYGISQGILRRRYQPGRLEPITVELWPLGHVFLKGHRLRVEVASSHFPMFDVNPNTGEDSSQATTTRIADQTLYTGAGQLSQLILPVIPEANTLPCSAAWC